MSDLEGILLLPGVLLPSAGPKARFLDKHFHQRLLRKAAEGDTSTHGKALSAMDDKPSTP